MGVVSKEREETLDDGGGVRSRRGDDPGGDQGPVGGNRVGGDGTRGKTPGEVVNIDVEIERDSERGSSRVGHGGIDAEPGVAELKREEDLIESTGATVEPNLFPEPIGTPRGPTTVPTTTVKGPRFSGGVGSGDGLTFVFSQFTMETKLWGVVSSWGRNENP